MQLYIYQVITLHITNISLSTYIINRNTLGDNGVYCITDVQIENACLSMAVLNYLNVPAIGWEQFFWPCRMENFKLKQHNIILDGCHNGYSVEMFLKGLRLQYKDKKLLVLFGAGQDKSLNDMIHVLLDNSDLILMVQSKHFRSHTENDLMNKIPEEKKYLLCSLQQQQQQQQSEKQQQEEVASTSTAATTSSTATSSATTTAPIPAAVSLGERLQWAVDHTDPKEYVL